MATPGGFPSDLEREESQLSLGSSEDYSTLDDIVNKKWKYAEISDLLQMQLAVMPGSQDNNGHSVIVIHAVEQQNFTVFNLGKILCYLKEVTSDQVRKLGFTILVDMRQGMWSMIKKTLEVIKVTFIEYAHQVIIMKPKSMWQRGRSSVTFSFKKSKYNFKCILLEHSADVFQYIPRSNVPTSQNGDFEYDHFKWISVIEKLEDLMTNLLSVKENYEDLQVIIAKDVKSADLEEAKKAVKNHLLLLEKFDNHKLESLLTTVENDVALLQSSTSTNPDFDLAFAQIFQLCDSLKTMNFYLNELWKKKGDSLDHTLQFNVFENDASQHQLWVYDQINYISCEITGIGTDVVSARASKSQIELYQKKINDKHAEINRVIEVGQRLISLNHPSSHLISNTIDEISATWEKLMDSIHQRDSLMSLSASFHEKEERFIQHSELWMDECSSDSCKTSIQNAVTKHNELADTVSVMYTSAYQDGHLLIEKLRKPVGEGSVPFKFIQATRHVKERLENLYDERNMIEEQWKRRQKYLLQSLNFQLFQKKSEKVSCWIKESGYDYLLKNFAFGTSVESVDILLKNHDCFESEAQMFYSQFNMLKRKGKELCDNGECRSEEMEPEISTLEKIVHDYAVVLDERREVLLLAKQCFSATNNFLKEVQNVLSSCPLSKVGGTISEIEERIVYSQNRRDNINKIGCSTLVLWSSLKEMVQSYMIQAEACNLSVKCDVALHDVENHIKHVEREKEKVDHLCILREKRLEFTVKRLNVFREINEYVSYLETWLQENVDTTSLADNLEDAQVQCDKFKHQYSLELEKLDNLMMCGQDINKCIDELDQEIWGCNNIEEIHTQLHKSLIQLSEIKNQLMMHMGKRVIALEECVEFYLLQYRFHNLIRSLNQLNSLSVQSFKVCVNFEEVSLMEEKIKDANQKLSILSQDIEMFSSAVSQCVSKGHYQSSSMTILNRTLIDKNRFVKENFVNRQRIVQFSIEFFNNYKKLLSTMEHCQTQFSSHECGQSLADIQYQQDFLKELKDSLHETVNVVKSQANHLLDIYLGSEQELETSDNCGAESNPRILVTPKKINQDNAVSVWSHQFNRAVFDDIVHKIETRLSRLNRLCDSRLIRLDQSKDVIQFETEVPKMLKWLDEVTSTFKKSRNDYGDSVQDVQKLLQDHETFSFNIVSPMHEKIEELKRRLAGFEKCGHYDLNRIRSIGTHLEQQWVKFNTDLETRLSNLKLSLSFQENSFNANNWCVQSEQFVQTLNEKMRCCDTSTEAKSLKDELSIYLSVTKEEQLDRVSKIKEISGFLHSNVLSEVTTHLNQVTEQTLREYDVIDEQLSSLHVKLCQIEEEKDKELRLLKQKERVIEELIATEEIYVQDLQLVVETYKPRFVSEFLPDSLKGKETIVFGNIQWIAEFHIETLWPQIQNAEKDSESLAKVFIDNAAVMTDLYVPYCQNKTKSEDLLAGHRSYLTRVSSLFGTDVPLSSLLIKPIQRITRYPLLLADCLKYTRLLGHNINLLQLAVKAVEEIPIQTNNAIHLSLLKCEEGLKWHKFGELLYQGLLLVSEPRLLITTEKERHVFLFENTVVFARKIDLGQAKFSYEYKFKIPLTSGVQIIESIEGEPLKFAFFTADHRMHLKCSSIDVKKSWVRFMKSSIQKHIEEKESKLRSLSTSGNRSRSNAVCTSDALAKDLSLQSSPFLPRRPSSPFSKTRIDLSKTAQNSSPPPVSYERFRVKDDYIPLQNDQHGLLLKKNQIIEVMEQLDTGRWFVQATSITGQIEHGWVPSSMLEPVVASVDSATSEVWSTQSRRHTELSAKDFASHQVINALKKATLGVVMSTDQPAGGVDCFKDTQLGKNDQNQEIEAVSSMKMSDKEQGITSDDINLKLKRKGVVRKRSSRTQHSSQHNQGLSSGDDENVNTSVLEATDEQVKKAREKIQYIMAELYQTEVEYVNSLQKLVDGFIHNIVANPMLPEALQGKEKMIFGNVSNIYEFHKYVFQELLEKAQNSLVAVAQCFLDKHSEFKLYVSYCENKPKSESFIWTYIHQGGTFFKDLQLKLGFREDIASFLIKPVQRITKYQLLLKDLLRSSQKAGWNVPLLEQALQLMQDVPKQANDAMALSMIVGYHGNIHANGQIVLQDEFTVYERARWAVGAHRHVFLLDLMMIITKEKDNDGLYVFKDFLKVHNMTLTEKQADSPCRFAVGTGQIGDWDKYYILEASSTEKKQEWIRTIKEILNQQFEMLKALKQPSARSRSSTVEIDMLPQKRCSPRHDSLSKQSNVLQDMSDSSLDELCSEDDISTTGNQENGTQEATKGKFNLYVAEEDCPAPVQGQYIFNLKKGQVYDIINSMGDWWLARIIQNDSTGDYAPGTEGWVPRTFMAPYYGEIPDNKTPSEITKDSKFISKGNSNARHSLMSVKPERSKKKSKSIFSSLVPVIAEPLSDESILEEQSVIFSCKLKHDYSDKTVKWFFNDGIIGHNCSITTASQDCILKIDNISQKNEGTYTCKVFVKDQFCLSSAKLMVVRCPNAPSKPVVQKITSTSVSLSWNLPFDGHSPVKLFIVECKDKITNKWSTLTKRIFEPTTIIDDLVPATEYVFRVIAANHIGNSESSEESESIKLDGSPFKKHFSLDPFEGHYLLKNEIAKGMFGTVYRCLHKGTQQIYAAKLIPINLQSDHCQNELNILALISHPNIVQLSAAYLSHQNFIIVMQYIQGLSPLLYFNEIKSTEYDVAQFCNELCCGLKHLHDHGIVHLGIKPDSIYIVQNSINFTVKIIHLSEAKFVHSDVYPESCKTITGYEAPEVINKEQVSTKSDMWSVGIMLYHIFCGILPYLHSNLLISEKMLFEPRQFSFLSVEVKDAILHLLQRKLCNRLSSTELLQHEWFNMYHSNPQKFKEFHLISSHY